MATGSIIGMVRDEKGGPVAGATVAITQSSQPHRDMAAVTSGDGSFRLNGMRGGSYLLEARRGDGLGGVSVELVEGGLASVEITLA